MITAGFTIIGRGNWSGGETYLRNMLGVIAGELVGDVRAKLFVSPAQADKIGTELNEFLAEPPIVHPAFSAAGRGCQLAEALVLGTDRQAAAAFTRAGVDVVFESATFLGRSFPVPVVSWIPDFQHRRLSHHFSRADWLKRDLGFQAQTRSNRTIMLSSEDARRDCVAFYPHAASRTAVVRFAVDVDPQTQAGRGHEIRDRYDLPARFFYLPNQFWSHKNHAALVAALARLAADGRLAAVPPVVLTGRPDDPRDPDHFRRLTAAVTAAGVSSHFRYLGLVPYADVFGLMAAADALINPSLFEGWSTTVEEAKALGTRMVLSDIPIHREQAPGVRFFDPAAPKSLADALLAVGEARWTRKSAADLAADHAARRRAYAAALLSTFRAALERGPPSRPRGIA